MIHTSVCSGRGWSRNSESDAVSDTGIVSARRRDRRIFDYDRHAAVERTTERIVCAILVCVRRNGVSLAKTFGRNVGLRSATVFDQPVLYGLCALARKLHIPGLRALRIGVALHRHVAFRKLRQHYSDLLESLLRFRL